MWAACATCTVDYKIMPAVETMSIHEGSDRNEEWFTFDQQNMEA